MSKPKYRSPRAIRIIALLTAAICAIPAGVAVMLLGAGTAAQDQTAVTLCSARKDGVYYFAAQRIGEAAQRPGLEVRVVETNGSMDNLKRMAVGNCDAAIVQLDALMVYSMERVSKRLKIAVPIDLYDEWLHLVCRRDAGIETAGDLLRAPEQHTILTDAIDSGAETTWRALTDLDHSYKRIRTKPLGGQEALDALLAEGTADCMAVVMGANAPFMLKVNERGEALRLVTVDLMDFRDSELVDNRVYNSVRIPLTTYRKLQAGPGEPEVETIAVRAMLVVAKAWAKAHPNAYESLLRAVSAAIPTIRERVKG